MAYPTGSEDLFEFICEARRPTRVRALERCLQVASEVRTAVFEEDYYDLDFRSEFALVHAHEFNVPPASTTRLHLFRGVHGWEDLVDNASSLESDYLGYIVLRPTPHGIVGRTMLAPPDDLTTDYRDNVRTAVREVVTFYGQQLSILAVPFMEQDGHLLTCAHVTSWMAHYSAVLNHFVPRRPVAAFAQMAGALSQARKYPSSGLVAEDTVSLLESLDMPPASTSIDDIMGQLAETRRKTSPWVGPKFPRWPIRRRLRARHLTEELCRYLNSGLSCLVAIDEHQVLVCGYLRKRTRSGRLVSEFICHDDQRGPYVTLAAPNRFSRRPGGSVAYAKYGFGPSKEGSSRKLWRHLIFPLPRGVRTDAFTAESTAGNYVLWACNELGPGIGRLLQELEGSDASLVSEENRSELLAIRSCLEELESSIADQSIALRTYCTSGTAFKAKYAFRNSDAGDAVNPDLHAVRTLRQFPMPRFIWVTELMDRNARDRVVREGHASEPAVLGEILMDASANPRDPDTLLVHLPGLFLTPATKTWSGEWDEARPPPGLGDRAVEIELAHRGNRYYTGRSSLKYDKSPGVHGQGKEAVSGAPWT